MPSPNALYVGAVSPVSTKYDLTVDDPAFDLSTATGGRLQVSFASGETATWECTLSPVPPDVSIQPSRVRLTRLHDAADLPEGSEGTLRIFPEVDLPASAAPVRGQAAIVQVIRDWT